jgi:hypothetical protein
MPQLDFVQLTSAQTLLHEQKTMLSPNSSPLGGLIYPGQLRLSELGEKMTQPPKLIQLFDEGGMLSSTVKKHILWETLLELASLQESHPTRQQSQILEIVEKPGYQPVHF